LNVDMTTDTPTRSPGWRIEPSLVVVLAGMAAATHVAKLPPAVPVLQQALGMDLVSAGFLLSLVQLAGMTLGLLVGLSVDTVGLRRSVLMGLGLLTVVSALGGFTTSVPGLMVLRALEGFGFLWVVMPAPGLIRGTSDPAHMQARMGLWGAYMPSGSALALLMGPLVMAAWGWPSWWWLLSLVTAVAAAAVWWWVPEPAQSPATVSAWPTGVASDWLRRLRLTLGSPGPWMIALSFAVYSGQWLAVIGFLPTIYTGMGLSAALTGVLSACVALANVTGNVLSGRLLQRGWPARRLLHIGFASMALGAIGAFVAMGVDGGGVAGAGAGDAWPLPLRFVSVVLFSAIGGLIPGTLFSMAVHLAPDESTVSTTVGFMQQWSAFGQFAGPPCVAWVAAQLGTWAWTWAVTGSLCLIGAWLALRVEHAWRIKRLAKTQAA
jgi:CP family cyanate transporter-like MFS transporter